MSKKEATINILCRGYLCSRNFKYPLQYT